MAEKEMVVERLKAVLAEDEKVTMAFVFGSFAKDRVMPESDIDVAVYLKEGSAGEYVCTLRERMGKAIGCGVMLTVLNDSNATDAWEAIRGIKICIKDFKFYLNYMLRVSGEAEDFAEYIEDFKRWRKRVLESRTA